MPDEKIAIVTGSNKGIGFAVVKGLCENFKGIVYLTSRDVNRGEEAVKQLNSLGLHPLYHQLDINDQNSVDIFKKHILKEHGGIDVLVNNAAIAFKHAAIEPFSQQAEETIETNYFSLLKFCNKMFPLLRKNSRVVTLSSCCGHLSKIPSKDLRNKFSDPFLTIENLTKLMQKFIDDAKFGNYEKEGWGNSAYNVSKVGCTALSFIQQKEFDNETPFRNISINAVHPGYVNTDMTSHKGPMSVEEGAAAPLYLALDEHDLKGKYIWFDKRIIDWYAEEIPPIC